VGTEDPACFLIATSEGHILINTGLHDSAPLIEASIRKLGFRPEEVKILLTMQAHDDHVAAMAEMQKISGAKVYITEADAPSLEDGGRSDPVFRQHWTPVKVDRRLKDGDVIRLGSSELRVVATPGHSKGSVSYTMTVDDGGTKRSVGIINMGTVVMPLKGNTKYPNIAEDFERSFAKQKKLKPEIWVAAHASQYRMQAKLRSGSFVDPQGYREAIERHEKNFRKELTQQK
jgi:metallo-beta-lactamase class B